MDEDKKASIEVKQLQRYYTVLRDFMAHFHNKSDIYPPNHEFTQDELGSVAPEDIIKWMNVKLYNKDDPSDFDRPLNGSHHTLDYYKKSISYFMPKKEMSWDPLHKNGNPTRSHEVNSLVKKVKAFDEETGGSRKRRSSSSLNQSQRPKHPGDEGKKPRPSLPPGFAPMPSLPPLMVPSAEFAAMNSIMRRMHAQNASFIDLFGSLSSSLEMFKTTLQANNQAIMVEMANLNNRMAGAPPPGAHVAHGAAAGPGAGLPLASGMGASPGVGTGMLDWQYVHADGVRRRVPPTWQFPHSNLQEMYILWHCGDYQNRISPMKLFDNSDVSFLGKRARMNLNEVKNLMGTIDEEASRKGKVPAPTMTLAQAAACFQAGLSGFNFSATTPTGKTRNLMRLKWSTLTKYNKPGPSPIKGETKADEAEAEDEEKAREEFIEPSPDDKSDDKWFYKHEDGIKRRVPSTFKFPMLGLEAMYVLWHSGDAERRLAPMKFFHASDMPDRKRSKTNLAEVRKVISIIDQEAISKGCKIKTVMTPAEARTCICAGYTGLNIPLVTSEGRNRDILSMKWSSAVKLKNPDGEREGIEVKEEELPAAEEEEEEPSAMEETPEGEDDEEEGSVEVEKTSDAEEELPEAEIDV